MFLSKRNYFAIVASAVGTSLLAGCHPQSQGPPTAAGAQQQEQANADAHLTPAQKAAVAAQHAANAGVKPE